ncbi:hypothetical protein SE17_28375, partial [Kouleothrix aurantiaca]
MHFLAPLRVPLLSLVFLALPFSAAASPPPPTSRDPDMARLAARGWSGPLAKRSGEVKAVIELADTPTALLFADAQQRGAAPQLAGQLAQRQLAQIGLGGQALEQANGFEHGAQPRSVFGEARQNALDRLTLVDQRQALDQFSFKLRVHYSAVSGMSLRASAAIARAC